MNEREEIKKKLAEVIKQQLEICKKRKKAPSKKILSAINTLAIL